MFTKKFLQGAAERAIKTFAQALLAAITTSAAGWEHIDWAGTFTIAGLAAAASVLTSLITPGTVAGDTKAESA